MKKHMKKISFEQGCMMLFVLYFILAGVLYYAAGKQLYERESRHGIVSVEPEQATQELTREFSVRQSFLCEMDKLEKYSVHMATFARKNTGVLTMSLWDETEQRELDRQSFRMEEIADGQVLECVLQRPADGVRGHMLAVVLESPESTAGNAVAPWYSSTEKIAGQQLYFGQSAVEGTLCFYTGGYDDVWTGPHYWKIMLPAGGVAGLCLIYLIYKKKTGKMSIVFTALDLMEHYRFLMKQLVSRDFKIKYRRSALGALWSFINPLMTMGVQYIVFSTIFKMDIENYPVYLLSGIVIFNFFTEATNVCLHAVTGNAGLITKVYVPKYIYPVSKTLSTGINLLISMLPLLFMSLATGIRITKAWLLLPFDMLCLLLFCMGMGFILSAVMVFFRDMQFIWSVLCMVFSYITPVFYPEAILSGPMRRGLQWNPMYQYILFFRKIILEGISPEPWLYLKCLLFSMAFLLAGLAVFKKAQDKFIFYI